jgi:hypothetical protein
MARVLPHLRDDESDTTDSTDPAEMARVGRQRTGPDELDDAIVDVPQSEPTETPAETIEETPAAKAPPPLTDRQRNMIVFERQWWRHAGSKEQAIKEQFGLSGTRYYQLLNQLLDHPEALAFDPIVVGRLRRLRATRSRTR